MELGELKGIGAKTEKKLNNTGIDSIDALADAEPDELDDAGISESKANKLIYRANKNSVTIQNATETEAERKNRDSIPSGMGQLDNALGGGFLQGNIVAIGGGPGTGKTQFAFTAMVGAVEKTGKKAVYIETERNRFSPGRIRQIAEDPDNIIPKIDVIEAHSLEKQKMAYEIVRESTDDYCLVVLDSWSARFRLSDKFEGRESLQQRSNEIARHINGIEDMVVMQDCPALVTAQVYGNPDSYGKNTKVYGGKLFQHMVNYFINTDDGQGNLHEVHVNDHPEFGNLEFDAVIDDTGMDIVS